MLAFEAIFTGFIALLLLVIMGTDAAVSAVIGGIAYIVPNAYFAKYAFRHSAADSPELAVRWFYFGEVIKIIATVLVFVLGFLLFRQMNVAVLILTYMAMLIINLWGNATLMRD
ncbi:MAG: ATP synthase subunit I [Gammaproteobacteria bacterium]